MPKRRSSKPRPAQASTTARGYGAAHQRERRRLQPIVDAGKAWCAQPVCIHPSRWIRPGTPWALGHNDDRTAYIGPVHADCNQRDGASRGGQAVAQRRKTSHPYPDTTRRQSSREW